MLLEPFQRLHMAVYGVVSALMTKVAGAIEAKETLAIHVDILEAQKEGVRQTFDFVRWVREQAGDDPVERELAQVAVEAAVESTRLMHRILAQGEPAGEEARKTELEGPFGGDSGSIVTASMRALTNGSPRQGHAESEPSRDGAPETTKRGRGRPRKETGSEPPKRKRGRPRNENPQPSMPSPAQDGRDRQPEEEGTP